MDFPYAHTEHTNASTRHAATARRAVRHLRAARDAGDDAAAALYAKLASEAVDRHLAARRARRLP